MENVIAGLIGVCLLGGIFFSAIGVIGILKLPDYFARAQAATCITTLGTLGALIAGIIYCAYNGLPAVWFVKIVLIILLIFVSSAITGHSLTKGTYKRGNLPAGEGFVKNDYEEDGYNDD